MNSAGLVVAFLVRRHVSDLMLSLGALEIVLYFLSEFTQDLGVLSQLMDQFRYLT